MELLTVSLLLSTDEQMKNLGCLFGDLHDDLEQFVECIHKAHAGLKRWDSMLSRRTYCL
jgi:hypothetical protein